jgi:hypothetical protein
MHSEFAGGFIRQIRDYLITLRHIARSVGGQHLTVATSSKKDLVNHNYADLVGAKTDVYV